MFNWKFVCFYMLNMFGTISSSLSFVFVIGGFGNTEFGGWRDCLFEKQWVSISKLRLRDRTIS